MACKGRLAELVLHITNFVYFISGLGILVVGALALDNPDTLVEGLSYIPQIDELSMVMDISGIALGPAIYLTCVGSLVIVLSILGIGGAFKRSKPIVMIFGLVTLLMMLFNIAVVMFYAIDPYFIEDTVQDNMMKVHEKYFQPVSFAPNRSVILPSEEHANAWVVMQFEESCCGVYSARDYYDSDWNNTIVLPTGTSVPATVPPSCCLLKKPNTVPGHIDDFVNLNACLQTSNDETNLNPEYVNSQGCSDDVMQLVTRYNYIYPVVAAGLSGLQAIILCLTLWLLVLHSSEKV